MFRIALFAMACLAGCGRMGFDEREAFGDGGTTTQDATTQDTNGSSLVDASIGSFGTMVAGISTQNSSGDRVWMSKFVLSEAAMLQQLVVYCGGQGSNVRGVVYADAAGTPTALRGTTNVVIVSAAQPGWLPLPLAAPVALAPGTYWLGTQNAGSIGIAYQSAMGASKFNNDLFSDGADATYGGGATTFSLQLSVYAEYTR